MSRFFRFPLLPIWVSVAVLLLTVLLGAFFQPKLPSMPRDYGAELSSKMEAMRDVKLPEEPVRIQQDVDYSEDTGAAWYPKGEAPILRELVDAGKLPPVAERVGSEPVVMRGVDGAGNYGGTWTRVASSQSDVSVIAWRLSASTLFRWSPGGEPIVPHVAKGYEVSEDYREWTIFLRKGMRWSDGHPFTTADIQYWWESHIVVQDKKQTPSWLQTKGIDADVDIIDDYTVRFKFEHPKITLLEDMSRPFAIPYQPAHYLAKFHPETGDQEIIKAALDARGLPNERALYNAMVRWNNVDCPRIWPWIYRSHRASTPQTFVRNPYYFAVDSEGRQLPYLDRVLFQEKTLALIPVAASGGDIAMQTRHIKFTDYTLLMEKREATGYELYHWFPATRSVWSIFPNINRTVDEGDRSSAWKAQFLRNKVFRQALSLAINREEIIEAEYNGIGKPSQIEPGVNSPYHSPELASSFIEFDPQRASKLLDGIGLDQRDGEGMRVFPDGSRMSWYMDFTDFTGEGPAQFVIDDWADIGLRVFHRQRSRPLFSTEQLARRHDFTIWTGESEFMPLIQPRNFVPTTSESYFAPGYGTWYKGGGLYGQIEDTNKFALEPAPESPVRRAMELLDTAFAEPDKLKRQAIFSEIAKINAEEVWTISIATPPPQLAVVKNGFRNVPEVAVFGMDYGTPGNAGIETYFWDEPMDTQATIEEMQEILLEPNRPSNAFVAAAEPSEAPAMDVGKWLARMCWAAGAFGLILLGARHPFIGRRFIILVPTLTIISVVGFTMIQIPPGSFVETRILELRMYGDEAAIKEVEQLAEQFYLNEPGWQRYLRWMGFHWFLTFDSTDKGLLQGSMGRSMETGESVNTLVGDRVMLTFVVSLGTVLFTWFTALPIGIYSAVRQYSCGDYIFTFVGFIGMCVPNFLLAILLMYWSEKYLGLNVTGLFSVEYAATPDWSWGKFIDLLKHLWVPVVIIGVGGTAGMIRVMRGNLLDELKKPYVTTARAKGVRPMKLLCKYPVRLALNPFISGIGGIFPSLVSGGAIVAIVLSLPMVGPVMLAGLMTEDLYLAASMLMMFSLLGVIGTLVSDLLLLWVDPRIRMEGGSK